MGIPGLASAFLVFLVFVSDLVVIEGGPRGQGPPRQRREEGGGPRGQGPPDRGGRTSIDNY